MRDYGNILDYLSGMLLIVVLVMAWLLVWCYLNPDETLAADNWKSIVTGGIVASEEVPYSNEFRNHPQIGDYVVMETPDSGCLGCHGELP